VFLLDIKFRISKDTDIKLVSEIEITQININRIELLQNSIEGKTIFNQLCVNHKLGIMDINESLEKLFKE